DGNDEAVEEVLPERQAVPGVDEICAGPLRRQCQRVVVDLCGRLEAGNEQRVDRQHDNHRPEQQHHPAWQRLEEAEGLHGRTVARSNMRSRKIVPSVTMRKRMVPSASASPVSVMPVEPTEPKASR